MAYTSLSTMAEELAEAHEKGGIELNEWEYNFIENMLESLDYSINEAAKIVEIYDKYLEA